MSRRTPSNPNKITPSRFRVCDGIGGELSRVLQRSDNRGRDISNTVVNELYDLDLVEVGSMLVRNGSRKMKDSGVSSSISSIFPVNLGRESQYGYIFNGSLTLVDIPEWFSPGQVPFDFEPAEELDAVVTVYPSSFPGDPA
jgi:hypothetical protein